MNNRDRIRKRTKYLTVSAMLCALGVILLSLGSLLEVLDISTSVFASMLCIYAIVEIGGFYPTGIWLSTSPLSLLLLPQKSPAVFYACFFGFYPILKQIFDRFKLPLSLICKLGVFHGCLLLIYGAFRLFLPSQLQDLGGGWFLVLLYVMFLVCFLLYDVALGRVITYYLVRLRDRFRIK
jgi:hypothetical protein